MLVFELPGKEKQMRNKIVAALVAGGLLVGAGFVTSIVSAPDTAAAQGAAADDTRGLFARGMEFLGDVLDGLVGEGTIHSDQADAILDAVEQEAAEFRAEREALREEIKGYLEDGVLDSDEAANLPEDHWLLSDALEEAWADDGLTTTEIREARPHPRRDAFRHGVRFGALLDDGGIDETEYESLPDAHPLSETDVSEYFEDDGMITLDELREIKGGFGPFGQGT
jgi:hypothetical protein